ncbi:HD domain-containing protein [Paenibacillus thermoaerophilus]|uniref:HD domain-containing protein n=1 Tax=Paenibacillus thermoaerophilus TaxID=1215385 RepID=A0ABW2V5J0_9BACL|nr:HD domain-containing protein [Paenibacillus thermoaerophilus]TMV12015.1 HD domain-containing protein [Paenibacillus thermoaerophilus]
MIELVDDEPVGGEDGGKPELPEAPTGERLTKQLRFIIEADRLKSVLRQTLVSDASRRENDAEHSWHLALMAMLLSEHAAEPGLDLGKVMRMLLVHDLVEIDAGDTFAYDEAGHTDKAEREQRAANRLFGLLPDDQRDEFHSLWREFEERATPEAKFAASLDRLQPMLLNYTTRGHAWRKHGVTSDRVEKRNRHIEEGAPALWSFAERLIGEAVERGFLEKGSPPSK